MVTNESFRKMALGFPDTEEYPHFERRAFRTPKRTFATLLEPARSANLMLSPEDQYTYSKAHEGIYPVAGGWGRMGSTTVELKKVPVALVKEMLSTAYRKASEKKPKK